MHTREGVGWAGLHLSAWAHVEAIGSTFANSFCSLLLFMSYAKWEKEFSPDSSKIQHDLKIDAQHHRVFLEAGPTVYALLRFQ